MLPIILKGCDRVGQLQNESRKKKTNHENRRKIGKKTGKWRRLGQKKDFSILFACSSPIILFFWWPFFLQFCSRPPRNPKCPSRTFKIPRRANSVRGVNSLRRQYGRVLRNACSSRAKRHDSGTESEELRRLRITTDSSAAIPVSFGRKT